MVRIPAYEPQVGLRDAPDIHRSFDTDASMFGGNQAKALAAWGGAIENAGDAAESIAKAQARKQRAADQAAAAKRMAESPKPPEPEAAEPEAPKTPPAVYSDPGFVVPPRKPGEDLRKRLPGIFGDIKADERPKVVPLPYRPRGDVDIDDLVKPLVDRVTGAEGRLGPLAGALQTVYDHLHRIGTEQGWSGAEFDGRFRDIGAQLARAAVEATAETDPALALQRLGLLAERGLIDPDAVKTEEPKLRLAVLKGHVAGRLRDVAGGGLIDPDAADAAVEDLVARVPETDGQRDAARRYFRSLAYQTARDHNENLIQALAEGRFADLPPGVSAPATDRQLDLVRKGLAATVETARAEHGLPIPARATEAPSPEVLAGGAGGEILSGGAGSDTLAPEAVTPLTEIADKPGNGAIESSDDDTLADEKDEAEQVALSQVPRAALFVARAARLLGRSVRGKLAKRLGKDAESIEYTGMARRIARLRLVDGIRRVVDESGGPNESQTTGKRLVIDVKDLGGPHEVALVEEFANALVDGTLDETAGNRSVRLDFGPIDDFEFVSRVEADTGLNLDGLHDVMTTDEMMHAFKGHGLEGETDPTQEPVSPEAMSVYRQVVRHYDRVSVRGKHSGATLTFEKDVNGVIYVVEQVRTGRGDFAFFNMWIKKRGPHE